ncbi:hypothetical protein DSM25558_3149 [Agrobacterium sp. DSM 25558]|nr:hypothetical protein DSM25558_3149 [Agrobacterium sp. DSM 25558]
MAVRNEGEHMFGNMCSFPGYALRDMASNGMSCSVAGSERFSMFAP